MGIQALRQRPSIKAFATGGRQFAQGACLGRVAKQFACARCAAVNQKGFEPAFQHLVTIRGEVFQRGLPLQRNHRRHRKTIPRQADRWLQQIRKRQATETRGQLCPGGGTTRHGHGCPAMQRHFFVAGRLHRLDAQGLRGCSVGVQAVQFVLRPDQREGVAADPATGGFDHRQGRGRGDGGIDGIATATHHFNPGFGGQWLRRGDHAAFGEDTLTL
ncbi:hypothetical protein D9M71_598320 [compost metagenome]